MANVRSLFNPEKGKMRVVGLCSGSGNTLWKALELQRELEKTLEGCPFEIVGVLVDQENAKAVAAAEAYGIPWRAVDIRAFYAERGAEMRDMSVRAEYDRVMLEKLAEMEPNYLMLAGYVWAITNVIMDRYPVMGVHPGDLTVQENGRRLLAGANGVKSAFKYNRPEVRASSYIASNVLDGGPILVTSPAIPVDYTLHEDEETRFRYYLKLVNEQNRLVGARTLYELASGSFQIDEDGNYYYKGVPAPLGIKLESWNEYPAAYQYDRRRFLNPRSIAVIGASNKPGIGRSLVENILGMRFSGSVYAVNVRGEDVLGAKGYTSVLDIPGEVDTAVIAVSSRHVLGVVEECGRKGVHSIVCVAAGFREVGESGREAEGKLLDIVRRYGMCMIGPNCMGLANTAEGVSVNCTINPKPPRKGNVAMLTQSGALGASLQDYAAELGIGFSIIVSTGNQAAMNMCDFLPYLEEDPNTKVILMYMEEIQEPVRFRSIVSGMKKPVVVLKSGRTSAGAGAASSHTGSMVGNDQIADAVLEQSGAIRVNSLEDAFLLTSVLSKTDMIRGGRVGIMSNTGGLDILMTDGFVKGGFTLPQLPEEVVSELRPQLLPEASVRNPMDLVAPAPAAHYALALKAMLKSGLYDAVVIACIPPATTDTGEVAQELVPLIRSADVPVLCCFFGPEAGGKGARVLKSSGIPTLEFPEKIADLLTYTLPKKKLPACGASPVFAPDAGEKARRILSGAEKGSYLTMEQAEELLTAYGIPVAMSAYIRTPEEAERVSLRYPVVAKIDHPDIVHKSDVGGVRLNIADAAALAGVVTEWTEKFPGLRGVFLQEQISGDIEMILGVTSDPALGHAILCGAGGTLVEILRDISYGHVPVSRDDAVHMLTRLKIYRLLQGYRGSKAANVDQLVEILLRLNRMIVENPVIREVDLNPLTCRRDDRRFTALDFRVRIG